MSAGEAGIPRGHLNILDSLLSAYGLQRRGAAAVPESVLNTNYRVETDEGPRFARIHATRRDRERIEREHRVSAWAAAAGLPAIGPIPDGQGETVQRVWGVFTSLYPWVEGRHAPRGTLSRKEAVTLGALLGDLQLRLRNYADPTLETGKAGSHWDTNDSIETLSRVDDLIRYYPAIPAERLEVQLAIRRQLELLEGHAPIGPDAFEDFERQPCHGDFHERNVLLGPYGTVAGVVDWEIVSLLPPLYELVRSATLLGLIDRAEVFASFMDAYRARVVRPLTDYRRAVEMYWQATLHDSWVYREVFVRGNSRAAQFFESHRARVEQFSDAGFRAALADRLAG